jgi:hypothetical protein
LKYFKIVTYGFIRYWCHILLSSYPHAFSCISQKRGKADKGVDAFRKLVKGEVPCGRSVSKETFHPTGGEHVIQNVVLCRRVIDLLSYFKKKW